MNAHHYLSLIGAQYGGEGNQADFLQERYGCQTNKDLEEPLLVVVQRYSPMLAIHDAPCHGVVVC